MKFLNLHTHKYTNDSNILELVNQFPNNFNESIPFYSIGIHPWYIVENEIDNDLKIIKNKVQNENCIAIGECGLDKKNEVSFDLQIQVFEKQLLVAQDINKPIIIHCVAAFEEIIAIKKKMKITVPMIIHGFSKNYQVAKQLLDNGFYLSFGKYLLKKPELESVFKQIPNDRFFLETDSSDENIETIYQLAAKYKNIEINELQEIINTNFRTVFNKS